MVVCKFFQEGNCRYGQNCRFEHIYGSKYSYHATAPAQAAPQAPSGVTDEQQMQLQTDIQSALRGNQWLLSCYAPHKEKPNFPGLSDLSPEEARLFIYEAKASNNVEQAVNYMNNLTKDARSKYEQLLTPTPNISKVLRSLYNGEHPPSPFTSGQAPQNVFINETQTDASSLFRSATQAVQSTSPFAQQPFGNTNNAQSIFAQANANLSAFNQPSAQNQAQAIFSQATRNVFGVQPQQNQGFFNTTDTAKSIFAQANKSEFETAPQPATQLFKSPFEQPSPFAQNNVPNQGNIFGAASNVFQQTPSDDSGVYSNANDVPTEDMEMFKADNFKLGFIPEIPPPHSMCV